MEIINITHPEYDLMKDSWEKFRYTFNGGHDFVNQYLKKFTNREDDYDFDSRKEISYCPAHAKAAIVDIKNAIYQRMTDIIRLGGSESYQRAVRGMDKGVDLQGNSMTGFIGRLILPELLALGKVGVFIDKQQFPSNLPIITKNDVKNLKPYIYMYKTEDIRSWSFDDNGDLNTLLLKDTIDKKDEDTGLVDGEIDRYRFLEKLPNNRVHVTLYDEDNEIISETELLLNQIPFVLFEITNSLLIDVADHQIALLNLASSDINYALKSNFPFYTEQFDPSSQMQSFIRQSVDKETNEGAGTKDENVAKIREAKLGVTHGRMYPRDTERPGFISPSAEPLRVSMEKQKNIIEEIRQLVNLNLTTIEPKRASAESKQQDEKGLEAGLSYIGLELEYGERQIAYIWDEYEGKKNEEIIIKYPDNYNLRNDSDRRFEAKELNDLREAIPSEKFKKEISKQIIRTLLGAKLSTVLLNQIEKEIDNAKTINTNHETIRMDLAAGLVSLATASQALGYPLGDVEQSKIDHAERLARIARAQMDMKGPDQGLTRPGARGVGDVSGDPERDAKGEKGTI